MMGPPLKTLVTGTRGFLGSRVVAALEQSPGVLVTPHTRDECPLEDLAPESWSFDVVVHLAARTARGTDEDSTTELLRSNITGTQSLLASLIEPPRRFLFASTADVYAPAHDGEVLDEEAPLAPRTVYAATKVLGELLVAQDAKERDYEAVILRFGHLFGPGEEAYAKLVPATINAVLRGRPPYVHGTGQALKDLLYVDDAAEAVRRAVVAEGPLPSPLNVVRGQSIAVREVVNEIVDVAGFLGRVRELPDEPEGAPRRFDSSKLHGALGQWDLVELREGLQREVEHVSRRCL
jgi:nucleoside-diphosphate-sugar epimerase